MIIATSALSHGFALTRQVLASHPRSPGRCEAPRSTAPIRADASQLARGEVSFSANLLGRGSFGGPSRNDAKLRRVHAARSKADEELRLRRRAARRVAAAGRARVQGLRAQPPEHMAQLELATSLAWHCTFEV